MLLIPTLSSGSHGLIEFDGWTIKDSKTLWDNVYNKSSFASLYADKFSFEIKFKDGNSRIYNTESLSVCPPRTECIWRIHFTSPKKPETLRLFHE